MVSEKKYGNIINVEQTSESLTCAALQKNKNKKRLATWWLTNRSPYKSYCKFKYLILTNMFLNIHSYFVC